MIKIGFDTARVNLMMACLRSVKYTIRVNDHEREGLFFLEGASIRGPPLPLFVLNVCRGSWWHG